MPDETPSPSWRPTYSTEVEAVIAQAIAALTPAETVEVVLAAHKLTAELEAVLERATATPSATNPLAVLFAVKVVLLHLDTGLRALVPEVPHAHD